MLTTFNYNINEREKINLQFLNTLCVDAFNREGNIQVTGNIADLSDEYLTNEFCGCVYYFADQKLSDNPSIPKDTFSIFSI